MSPRSYPGKASHLPSTGRSPASADEVFDRYRRAWHDLGVAVIDPTDLAGNVEREFLRTIANRLYGRRTEQTA